MKIRIDFAGLPATLDTDTLEWEAPTLALRGLLDTLTARQCQPYVADPVNAVLDVLEAEGVRVLDPRPPPPEGDDEPGRIY